MIQSTEADGKRGNPRPALGGLSDFQQHFPYLVAAAGGGLFLIQTLHFAQTQSVILDEGLYMYKGFLFVSGRYTPFQDYGPWTNHMPLSFLIPGVAQHLFGLGLRTGRYFSVLLGVLLVLGLWIVANRLGGKWWAAGSVAAIALNPFLARLYSHAKAEVLGACMLVWVFVFVLGEGRRPWQLIIGSLLAGILAMTRMNLGLVLPLILAYGFWQYGIRIGLALSVAGIAPVFLGHVIFWPGILKLWAAQLPSSLTPFLNAWRISGFGSELETAGHGLIVRLRSFFQGVRFHFLAYVSVTASLFLWPRKEDWQDEDQRRNSLLLVSLFAGLLLLHAWSSLAKGYCIYCFRTYNAYFTPAALLVLVALNGSWRSSRSPTRSLLTMFLLAILSMGVGFSASEEVGVGLLRTYMSTIGGVQESWISQALVSQFGLSFRTAIRIGSIVFALFLSIAALVSLCFAWRHFKLSDRGLGLTHFIWLAALVVGAALSPSRVLGNGYREYDCQGDILARYEEVGTSLAESVPAGSLIYWQVDSPTLLLYMPDVHIFPQQLNGGSNFNTRGSADENARLGTWNPELAKRWISSADLILVERSSVGGLRARFPQIQFEELLRAPKLEACQRGTRISIMLRKE